jgi:predicted metal-dependent HD superfamily phosphohydrolase
MNHEIIAAEVRTAMLDPNRFTALWRRLGGRTEAGPVFAALAAAYAEPHRTYHNGAHIADCLGQFDAVRTLAERPDEVEMALWFHDAVYDPRAADNEEKSAAWAVAALTNGGVVTDIAQRIGRWILATRHAAEMAEPDARLVCDVDLSILGREPAAFDAYDRAIRAEYEWVPEAQYRDGRARVLRGFLERPAVFQTEAYRARYETQARENLQRAVGKLHGSGDAIK